MLNIPNNLARVPDEFCDEHELDDDGAMLDNVECWSDTEFAFGVDTLDWDEGDVIAAGRRLETRAIWGEEEGEEFWFEN